MGQKTLFAWALAAAAAAFLVPAAAGAAASEVVLPEGAARCAALGIAPGACTSNAVMEAAQRATDPALWLDKTVGGDVGDNPGRCFRPLRFSNLDPTGRFATYLCHRPPDPPDAGRIARCDGGELLDRAELARDPAL